MTMSGGTRTSSYGWRNSYNTALLRWLSEGLLSLLFPPRCLQCGVPTPGLEVLCKQCEAQLPILEGVRCLKCQDILADPRVDLCRTCGTRDRGFDLARFLGPYEGGWSMLVQALKFDREQALSRFLSKRLSAYLAAETPFGDFGLITFVPMSRRDRRDRGFNQAKLLARDLGKNIGIPLHRTLAKVRETTPQAALPARERRRNLRGAFQLIRSGKEKVLLVDDIYTTGSTVEECALTLKRGGYEAVFVLTAARA